MCRQMVVYNFQTNYILWPVLHQTEMREIHLDCRVHKLEIQICNQCEDKWTPSRFCVDKCVDIDWEVHSRHLYLAFRLSHKDSLK